MDSELQLYENVPSTTILLKAVDYAYHSAASRTPYSMHTPFMHPVSPSFFVLEGLGRRFHSKFFHRFPHHSQERLGHHMQHDTIRHEEAKEQGCHRGTRSRVAPSIVIDDKSKRRETKRGSGNGV